MRGRGGEGRVVGTKIKRTLLPKKPNNMHWFVPLLYSMYWLLHVSFVTYHDQGGSKILLSYLKYKSNGWFIICVVTWPVGKRSGIRLVFRVTHKDLRRSLMMAGYCWNM
jgi:hypothetical protein